MTRYDLQPTADEVGPYKLPNGLISNAEAERRALRDKIADALEDFDEEKMTPTEGRLLAILQAIFDGGLL